MVVVPNDILPTIENGQIPNNRMELQQLLGMLGYWRKHVLGFSVLAHLLYNLLWKSREWDWTSQHTESLNILKNELKTYQGL